MLKELFEKVVDESRKAVSVDQSLKIVPLPGRSDYMIAERTEHGIEVTREKPDIPYRNHKLDSVAEIRGAIEAFKSDDDADLRVWVGSEAVTVILDDMGVRKNRLICPLAYTDEFAQLHGLRSQTFPQKALVRLLQVDLAAAATESSEELRQACKVLNNKVVTTSRGVQERSRVSLGRDLEAEIVSDSGSIPDRITFAVEVFNDPALRKRYTVEVTVEQDPTDMAFMLLPKVRDLVNAEMEERQRIREILDPEVLGCPVLLGSPEPFSS